MSRTGLVIVLGRISRFREFDLGQEGRLRSQILRPSGRKAGQGIHETSLKTESMNGINFMH
jgi:hypothetical protein